MRNVVGMLILILICSSYAKAEEIACNSPATAKLVEKVLRFDCENLDECKRYMDMLYNDAYVASGCLIRELHVVDVSEFEDKTEFKNSEQKQAIASKVVQALRTLRYITSLDFSAKTSENLKNKSVSRNYFLTLKYKNEVPFFAEKMSRGIIYVAKRDAQVEIIHKWKEWYVKEGKDYKYKKNDDMAFWFF